MLRVLFLAISGPLQARFIWISKKRAVGEPQHDYLSSHGLQARFIKNSRKRAIGNIEDDYLGSYGF